jgi:hypothetical protein
MRTDDYEVTTARRGIPAMDPELAIVGLEQALAGKEPFVTVVEVDWERFFPVLTAQRPCLLLNGVNQVRGMLDTAPQEPVAVEAMEHRQAVRPPAHRRGCRGAPSTTCSAQGREAHPVD